MPSIVSNAHSEGCVAAVTFALSENFRVLTTVGPYSILLTSREVL